MIMPLIKERVLSLRQRRKQSWMTLAARSLSHDPIALGIRGALVWCTRVLDPSLSSLFPLCWPLPPLSVPLLPLPPLLCSSCCPCSTQGFDGAARRQQRYGCTRGRASGQMFSFELESDRRGSPPPHSQVVPTPTGSHLPCPHPPTRLLSGDQPNVDVEAMARGP